MMGHVGSGDHVVCGKAERVCVKRIAGSRSSAGSVLSEISCHHPLLSTA